MAAKRGKQAVRGGGIPAWVLFGVGVLVGAAAMGYAVKRDWVPSLRTHELPTPNPEAKPAGPGEPGIADSGSARSRPNFDFYQVLPEKEVVIPDAELSAKAKAEAQAKAQQAPGAVAPAASTAGRYLLQVGSFPSADQADATKARLALQGFVANVQPVAIKGETWYRVRLGPYRDAGTLEKVKQQLAGAGIPAIALKEKN